MRKTCKIKAWFLVVAAAFAFGIAGTPPALAATATGSALAVETSWHETTQQQDAVLLKYALADTAGPDQPITITSSVEFINIEDASSGGSAVANQVWLAGVAGAPNEKPTLLALVWQLDTSSWFPTWRLYLRSDAGLLPTREQLVQVGSIEPPVNGGKYTTVFSYDPKFGVLSIRITNDNKQEVVFRSNTQLRAYSGELYPGVGVQGPVDGQLSMLQLHEISVQPRFIPAGARVQMTSRSGPGDSFINMRSVDRRAQLAIDLALPTRPLENQLCLLLDDGKTQSVLMNLDKTTGNQTIPLAGEMLPSGNMDLVLEYVTDGAKYELSREPLRVGALDLHLASLNLTTAMNGEPEIAGVVNVAGDGAMPPFNVLIKYELSTPGISAPLHEQWKNSTGTVKLPVPSFGKTVAELPFRIPLGTLANALNSKEVFAKVAVSTDLNIPFATGSAHQVALGERAPVFPKVGEYTVLRGDFHSHSTVSDGELSPRDRIWESYMYGYDTLALTDHRSIDGYKSSTDYANEIGLTLVRGFETGIEGKQHMVVLGTDDGYQMRDEHSWSRQPNSTRVFYQDQAREVIAHGGYIIYAHPGGEWVPPGPYSHPDGVYGMTDEMQWLMAQGFIQGVESRGNLEAARRDAPYRWAIEQGLALFDVSDIHGARNFSRANQSPVTLVLAKENSPAGVLEALRDKRTLIWRSGQLRGTSTWLVPFIDAMLDFQIVEHNGETSLQITNKGALGLYGSVQIDGGAKRLYVMSPNSSIYIPASKDAESVSIAWGNVLRGPGQALITTHTLR